MEQATMWTTVFNQFDPWRPLSGDKLETWFVEREYSPLPRLELSLRPDRIEHKILLVGQRGCGKTSELLKLISKMQNDYLTVYVDLFGSLDLATASRLELLFCIGAAAYQSAKDAGLKLPKKLWEDLVSSLSTLVREQTNQSDFRLDPAAILSTVICTAGTTYPVLATVGRAVGEGVRFGFGVGRKDVERLELDPILREVIARVNAIIREVGRRATKPMLLVADGLDKITDCEQAARIFGRSWALTAIGCRALYTVPTVLYYSTLFREVQNYFDSEELSNVRLYSKGQREKRDIAGFATMRDLVKKRLRSASLSSDQVFAPQALDMLIRMSGGVMRDVVTLVRQAALEAEMGGKEHVDALAAQRAINRLQREMQAGLFEDHYRALAEIERSGGLIDRGDEAQMELLRDGYVLSYQNGFWRDIHPIILPILADYRPKSEQSSGALRYEEQESGPA